MALCKFCGKIFSWGYSTAEDKWVPLVPVGEEGALDRTFQDEEGRLRASHRDICDRGGPSVRVARLAKKIPAHALTVDEDLKAAIRKYVQLGDRRGFTAAELADEDGVLPESSGRR